MLLVACCLLLVACPRFGAQLAPPDVVGAWAPVIQEAMGTPRVGCAAGVLLDGSLLVAGGDEVRQAVRRLHASFHAGGTRSGCY